MLVLVINSGSSSLKYQLFDMSNEKVLAKGNCQKIGLKDSFIEHKFGSNVKIIDKIMENHDQAIQLILNLLTDKDLGVIKDLKDISAIGHRVLHGGEIYKNSVLINDEVLDNLNKLKSLGPLHMPANISGILACKNVLPNIPQVAVFDTAFHSEMPKEAFLYAIPYEEYIQSQIRKYGFHGTSHKFVSYEVAKILGKDIKDCKIITVHLGNGSSMAAIKDGKSVDTTMGFTPLEGLIMGTRSGDVDASVVTYISKKYNLKGDELENYFNKKCGALGISGISSDMRDINAKALEGDERAKLVIPMMAHRIKKYIGAYLAILNGADAIVFTGGIGENQEDLRELSLKDLDFFGIKLDVNKNNTIPRGTTELISQEDSKIKVYRIPTNEELLIARDTISLIKM